MSRRTATLVAVMVAALISTSAAQAAAQAAAPDGNGGWADAMTGFAQGKTKAGLSIRPLRSDPTAALGVAENGTVSGSFVSLGFGGRIDLRFDNYVCNGVGTDLQLFEATVEPYTKELVDVYVSKDGLTYAKIASALDKDANVALPASLERARYVRLVDVTNKRRSDKLADGYDVDGVRALHTDCAPDDDDDDDGDDEDDEDDDEDD